MKSLADVHNALNTTDRMAAMVRKMRAYWWPAGRDINSVAFMMETKENQDDVPVHVPSNVHVLLLTYF